MRRVGSDSEQESVEGAEAAGGDVRDGDGRCVDADVRERGHDSIPGSGQVGHAKSRRHMQVDAAGAVGSRRVQIITDEAGIPHDGDAFVILPAVEVRDGGELVGSGCEVGGG